MATAEMLRLSAIVPRAESDCLMRRLLRLRCAEVEAPPAGLAGLSAPSPDVAHDAGETARLRARVDAALAFLHARMRTAARPGPCPALDEEAYRESDEHRAALSLLSDTEALRAEEDALAAEEAALRDRAKRLSGFLPCSVPLSLSGTRYTRLLFGTFPPGADLSPLRASLDECAADLTVFSENSGGLCGAVLCHEDDEAEVSSALSLSGFTRLTGEEQSGTAEAETEKIRASLDDCRRRGDALRERGAALSASVPLLEVLSDYTHLREAALSGRRLTGETESTVCLSAWVPARAQEAVGKQLDTLCCAYEFRPPAEDEDPPVLLDNPRGFAPFEDVMAMYSLPAYGTFDPTRIMSVFYFIIFGLMLADVGYGVLLTGVCLLLIRLLRPAEGTRRLLSLFAICGVSCMLCGVLMGGYFGNLPAAVMQNVFHVTAINGVPIEEWSPALLFDPLQDTVLFGQPVSGTVIFLVLSLVLGLIHIATGMVIQMVILFRQGEWFSAVFDVGSWLVIFAGIGLYFFLPTAGLIAAGAGLLMVLLTHGRKAKNPLMKLLGGVMGLYSFISYCSDVLSYARILALGLASTVIAQVINMASGMVVSDGMLNPFGLLFFLVLFLVGHAANLLINLLGTYVHTSRLQYIEFFGKFFTDGGRPFSPLVADCRYTRLSPAENTDH